MSEPLLSPCSVAHSRLPGENCSLFSPFSLLSRSPISAPASSHCRPSDTNTAQLLRKRDGDTFPHLIFTTAPLTQATAARLLTTPCSVYTLLIATFSRHIVTAGSGPGSGESQDTAWERDSVSEASSCCLLRNLHGYIWYCQTLTRPWLCCSKGRNLLKCFTWNKKSINLKCSR